MPCEDGGRYGSNMSIDQGMLRIVSNHQELGERRGTGFPSARPEGA